MIVKTVKLALVGKEYGNTIRIERKVWCT